MARDVSEGFLAAVYADQSGEAYLTLVLIQHEDLDTPIRLASGYTRRLSLDPLTYGVRSNGQDWLYVGMQIKGPDSKEKSTPAATLTIANIDPGIVALLRSTQAMARVDFFVVRAETPDIIEWSAKRLKLVKANYTDKQVTLDVTMEPFTAMPWPAHRINAERFPNVHAVIR